MRPGQFKPKDLPCPCAAPGGKCYKPFGGKPCRMWRCEGCKAVVPACNGAADDYPELCDACAAQARNT